ncbi:MAG TPA: hypothetical protein DCM14_06815 [Clostridiales bacterium UBA8153]|nr:hypothetical protein [Clostridiales bacterium UBA8153]
MYRVRAFPDDGITRRYQEWWPGHPVGAGAGAWPGFRCHRASSGAGISQVECQPVALTHTCTEADQEHDRGR